MKKHPKMYSQHFEKKLSRAEGAVNRLAQFNCYFTKFNKKGIHQKVNPEQ